MTNTRTVVTHSVNNGSLPTGANGVMVTKEARSPQREETVMNESSSKTW